MLTGYGRREVTLRSDGTGEQEGRVGRRYLDGGKHGEREERGWRDERGEQEEQGEREEEGGWAPQTFGANEPGTAATPTVGCPAEEGNVPPLPVHVPLPAGSRSDCSDDCS